MRRFLVLLFIPLFIACNNNGQESLIEENDSVLNMNIVKELDYIPEDFFDLIFPASPLDKVKQIFGIADKVTRIGDVFCYYYELKNGYLLIESTDNVTISVITLQSNNSEPFVRFADCCPYHLDEEPLLLLGKSTFLDLPEVYHEVEIGGDRCDNFALSYNYGARHCSYHHFVFGTFLEDWSDYKNSLKETETEFDTRGVAQIINPGGQSIDYIILGDMEIMKETHYTGAGVHCDFIYLR